jgi:hypothetical protein
MASYFYPINITFALYARQNAPHTSPTSALLFKILWKDIREKLNVTDRQIRTASVLPRRSAAQVDELKSAHQNVKNSSNGFIDRLPIATFPSPLLHQNLN